MSDSFVCTVIGMTTRRPAGLLSFHLSTPGIIVGPVLDTPLCLVVFRGPKIEEDAITLSSNLVRRWRWSESTVYDALPSLSLHTETIITRPHAPSSPSLHGFGLMYVFPLDYTTYGNLHTDLPTTGVRTPRSANTRWSYPVTANPLPISIESTVYDVLPSLSRRNGDDHRPPFPPSVHCLSLNYKNVRQPPHGSTTVVRTPRSANTNCQPYPIHAYHRARIPFIYSIMAWPSHRILCYQSF